MAADTQKDFFVSYNKADRAWAEWIAWQLEAEGYTTILQAWDFRPGSNFVLEMQSATRTAKRTIAVLSPEYLTSLYTQPEWAAAFVQDPTGQKGLLLPVRVRPCVLTGLLPGIIYLDLVDLDEATSVAALLAGVRQTRAKPSRAPTFPGKTPPQTAPSPHFPGNPETIWNVPHRRNPFFTGRESLLTHLYTLLRTQSSVALSQPPAISGLGGIGKTQLAVEYAYRYRQEYQYVLWAQANSVETLLSSFVTLARLLHLPEQDDPDQQVIVQVVKTWLETHTGWLLIFDNVDDLPLVDPFLPPTWTGHLLFTTRSHVMRGRAHRLDIDAMETQEGIRMLLCRIGLLATETPLETVAPAVRADAATLVDLLGGLPLALDQAGAYIEETACNLSSYLTRYRERRRELHQRRSNRPSDHPEPVATTWSLAFQQVERTNPAAADLLRFCAFLHPDEIPEALLTQETAVMSLPHRELIHDSLKRDEAMGELLNYSLIQRLSQTKALAIHRLVQAVLIDDMDAPTQQRWAENSVQAVAEAFPFSEVATWPLCQRYLPHALRCADFIQQWNITTREAAKLLHNIASYLYDRGQYRAAESLYQRALTINEHVLGPKHPDTAGTLHNLALLYDEQGKYEQAEPLYQRALTIKEHVLGPEHPSTVRTRKKYTVLLQKAKRDAEA